LWTAAADVNNRITYAVSKRLTYFECEYADVLQWFVGISADVGGVLEHVQTCSKLRSQLRTLTTSVPSNTQCH